MTLIVNGIKMKRNWREHYDHLPVYWKAIIERIKANNENIMTLVPLVPKFQHKKAQIIFWYYAYENYSLTRSVCNCGSKIIHQTLQGYAATHEIPVPLKKGRPKKVTSECMTLIEDHIISNRHISLRAMQQLLHDEHFDLSIGTINHCIHLLRYSYKPPKQRQALTAWQIERRLAFAYSMIIGGLDRENIVFSDESRFCRGPDHRWIWRRYGDRSNDVFADKDKFSNGVMVFGAIRKGFKSSLLFPDGSVDADEYIRMLDDCGLIESLDNQFNRCNYVFQ